MSLLAKEINFFLKNNFSIYSKNKKLLDKDLFRRKYINTKNYFLNNLEEGDVIAILLDKDYEYLIIVLVCMEIGVPYIPMDSRWPKERVAQIKKISKYKFQVNQDNILKILNYVLESKENRFQINSEKILYIMFTSGTTGVPKGVKIKRESYFNFLVWIDEYFKHVTSKDKLLSVASYSFDLSLVDIAFLIKKKVHFFISKFETTVLPLAFEIEKYEITMLATVPNNFSMLLNEKILKKFNLKSLNTISVVGSKFYLKLYLNLVDNFNNIKIYNCYGPTEATIYTLVSEVTKRKIIGDNVSIGTPILNTEAILIDEMGKEVKNGELLLSGISIMDSYIGDMHKTQEVTFFLNNKIFYKTGDLAFIDNNNYYIYGRKDDVVKTSGFRVSLSDVDTSILNLRYVESCMTLALNDNNKENILISFIILKKEIKIDQIYEELSNILPSYQIPAIIKIIDEFPLNSASKICKKTLYTLI
ncbi:MAG TPA: hypothetical protein EYG89_05720 [Bacteroidia bacterium]|nr:hypothetical protein [Bacteroidia bacterium]